MCAVDNMSRINEPQPLLVHGKVELIHVNPSSALLNFLLIQTGRFKSSFQFKVVNVLNKAIVFQNFSIHRGREFVKLAGNRNFNYLLNAFLLIFVRIVRMHVFPSFSYVVPFPNLLLFSDSFPELCVFSIMKIKSDIVHARAQAAIL